MRLSGTIVSIAQPEHMASSGLDCASTKSLLHASRRKGAPGATLAPSRAEAEHEQSRQQLVQQANHVFLPLL